MDLTKRDSEQTKLTNRFSNDTDHRSVIKKET